MDELLNEQLKRIEKERKHRLRWIAGVMILAIVVSFFTTDALTLSGTAKVNTESVLSCAYRCHSHTADCYDEAGSLVCGKADYCLHSHTADCYDYYGVLVCPLPELAPHVHGESCYEERRELVCALEEGEEHLHGEDCYEMARVLCCGLEERVPHAHGAECYAADGALVCGLPELEAHVHGEECLVTVELSPEEAAYRGMLESGMPPQRFQGELKDLRVTVEAEADTFPAETEMRLSPVPAEEILDAVSETLEREAEDLRLQAVDIAFFAPDGTELEPAKPVRVTLEAAELAGLEEPLVVHVDGEGEARVLEQEAPPTDELVFEAESFSVYAVVYTVDFHWEVDGQEISWSLPGGGVVRLAELAEVLGIVPASEEHTEAERFAANVASLAVSDPTLLWAGKPETDMSLGELWESLGGVEPSGELTGEELAALAAAPVKARDWVLLSLRPFTSEESLRVTMTNGDEFTLRVTDAQGDVALTWPNVGRYGRNGTIRLHFADMDGNEIEHGTSYNATLSNQEQVLLRESDHIPAVEGYTFHHAEWNNKAFNYFECGTSDSTTLYFFNNGEMVDSLDLWYYPNTASITLYYQKDDPGDDPDPEGVFLRVQYRNKIGKALADTVKLPLQLGDDIDLLHSSPYQDIYGAVFQHIVVQGQLVTRVTYTTETEWGIIGYRTNPLPLLPDIPVYGEISKNYVTFYHDDDVVLREARDQKWEYVANYVYDDGSPQSGTGTVAGPGTQPIPEPDLGNLDPPAALKTLTPNLKDPNDPTSGDGTYTLTLSVTAPELAAQNKNKANIVVVYDSSNSMNEPDEYIPDQNGTYGTLYGFSSAYGEEYKGLYEIIQNGSIYDRINRTWVNYARGQRYRRGEINRHTHAKAAVEALAQDLLDLNATHGSDTVELALVEYATDIRQTTGKTSSYEEFKGWVEECGKVIGNVDNGLAGATNWDAALRAANDISFGDNDQVYIVFLSDGDPTVRVTTKKTDDGDQRCLEFTTPYGRVYGTGSSDIHSYNFKDADNFVRESILGKKILFTVGFGDATDKMGELANNGYYIGTNNDLSAAFDSIVGIITSRVGYTDVKLTDGITSMTSTSLAGGNPEEFRYKVSDKDGNDITDTALKPDMRSARLGDPTNEKESLS